MLLSFSTITAMSLGDIDREKENQTASIKRTGQFDLSIKTRQDVHSRSSNNPIAHTAESALSACGNPSYIAPSSEPRHPSLISLQFCDTVNRQQMVSRR